MSKHSEAFEAWLTVERYCNDTDCDNCCFGLGKDHKYCPFDTYFICPRYITNDGIDEEISERVHHLEQLEIEDEEKHE